MEKISGGIEQEKTTICGEDDEYSISQKASQTLWATGKLSGPIPDGFYSVLPEGRLRQLDTSIPSLDGIFSLDSEDIIADIILVDAEKDKKLSMLKQLAVTLVKGLDSNPSILTKKIAGLVSDIYKQSNLYSSPARAGLEDFSCASTNQVQMLGQIRQGTCHARAILFKVLADSVGLPSSLVVGLPSDGIMERSDSHKHMSVTVILNSVEQLVDLVRSPGQLLPNSTKAILMSHISAAGEGDCADNDSCDSPLEPNSPLCSFTDQVGVERVENSDAFLSPHHCKLEASGYVPGPSLRNIMLRQRMKEGKLNSSKSEPNVGNALWWNNRKKVAAEQHTVSLSPEHPLLRARGRSNLGCQRDYFRGFTKDVSISRSAGASPETRRRRRSISEIPKIGDDIVRAVRAMNEALKLNRLAKEHVDSGGSLSTSKEDSELDSHEHYADKIFVRKQKDNHATAQQMWDAVCNNDKKAVYRLIVCSEADVNTVYEPASCETLTLEKVMLLQDHNKLNPEFCILTGETSETSSFSYTIGVTSEGEELRDEHNGCSLLHLACETSDIGMLELLLQYGANINAVDSRGQTPLHCCIIVGNPSFVKLLLARGADPQAVTREGKNPYEIAIESNFNDNEIVSLLSDSNG